jgi:hypothetical protein
MIGHQLLQLQLMPRKRSDRSRPTARQPRGSDRRTRRRTPSIIVRRPPTALPSGLLRPMELFAAPGSMQSTSLTWQTHTNERTPSPPEPRPRIHVAQGHALAPAPRPPSQPLVLTTPPAPKKLSNQAALGASPAAPNPEHRQTIPTQETPHHRQPSDPSTRPPSSASPRTVKSQHQTSSQTSTHWTPTSNAANLHRPHATAPMRSHSTHPTYARSTRI